jgi:gliding motility-associated-like protein
MNHIKNILLLILLSLFTLGQAFASDFYWIGESGDWNNPSHWSNTSGGNGGFGIPTENDNVFFDSNSFIEGSSLSINGTAHCKNFSWTNSKGASLNGDLNAEIIVNGSYIVNTTFTNAFLGKTTFTSSLLTNPLDFGQSKFLGHVEFNGSGSWNLISDLTTVESKFIYLKQGELFATNVTIYSGGIDATSSTSKTLNINGSVVYNHNKAIFDSPQFNLINNNSTFAINNFAEHVSIGNVLEENITYSSSAKKANTCGTIPFTITTFVLTDFNNSGVSCQDSCDAIVYASVTGGTGGFTYLWLAAGTPSTGLGDTLFNACQGNVGIQVTDVNQSIPFGETCTDQITVSNPIALAVNLSSIGIPQCNGDCDGFLGVAVNFGTSPYTVSWAQVPDVTSNISNLCGLPGGYDITVVDTNGCTVTKNFILNQPDIITFTMDSTNINCFGTNNGTATVSAIAGGNPPGYTLLWDTPPGGAANPITNLSAGIYVATVTDNQGCFAKDSVTIIEINQLQLDTSTVMPVCGGTNTGMATATVIGGGSGPFTHNWSTGFSETVTVSVSSGISSLAAGNYCDTIVDLNGCDTVICFTITQPDPVATTTTAIDVSCNGNCNGEAITVATGGSNTYTYAWDSIPNAGGFSTVDSIVDLCPGTYFVTVSDASFCSVSDTIVIAEPLQLLANTSTTIPECIGDNNGTASAAPSGGTGNPAIDFTYSWTGPACNPTPGNTQTITNLCPGEYIVTITDSALCTLLDTVTINDPLPLNLGMSFISENCSGNCDGAAIVNATGGTGNPDIDFTYTWSPDPGVPSGQGTDSIFNICANTYTVSVTDSNNCPANNSITLIPLPTITPNLDTTDLSCNGVCNGTATVQPTGSGPFTVSWNGTPPIFIPIGGSNTFTGLCAGAHTALLTDVNLCPITVNFTINEPAALTLTANPSAISCFGLCDGNVSTTAGGGSGALSYIWDEIPTGFIGSGQGTDSIFNICAGTYYVILTDDSLCTISDTAVVNEPAQLIPLPSVTQPICNGVNIGTATANPIGGTGDPATDFTYSWTGPACNPTPGNFQTITSLCPGSYIVTVTDSSLCTATDSVTIIDPQPLNLAMSFIGETCSGDCDGAAIVNATGGTGDPDIDFTYTWTPDPGVPSGQGTDSIFNICANTYTVTVTDSNNCTDNNNTTIVPLPSITPNLDTTDLTCNGICNGTATVQPTGSGPFTVSWNGAPAVVISIGGSNTVTGLCAGAHTVLLTDLNNCPFLLNFTINEPAVLNVIGTTTSDISCFALCDGNASTNVVGGSGTLLYTWDGIPTGFSGSGQGTNSIFNLCAGVYQVIVMDDSLCTISDTVEIFAPNEINPGVSQTNITCNGLNDGTALSSPTGGSGTIASIDWISVPGGIIQTGNPIGALSAGQYEVTVTDDNACTGIDTVTIIDPPLFTVSADVTKSNCGTNCSGEAFATPTGGTPGTTGYTFVWNTSPIQTTQTSTGLCNGEYQVTVTDSLGCQAQDTTEINSLVNITINPTIVTISCNGICDGTATINPIGGTAPYTYLWASPVSPNNLDNATGLCPGFVVVTVTDFLGCVTTDSIDMPVAPSVLQSNGVIDQQISCNNACDAEVSHNPTGGTAPYTSIWTPLGIDTSNVCDASATITVTDFNGCIASDTLIISDPDPLVAGEVIVNVNCFGDSTGSITLNPTGGAGGTYNYVWTGPIVGSGSSTTNLPAGVYSVTITDSNLCSVSITDTITQQSELSAISTGNNMSCNGICDGMMTVIVNGGVAPYTYLWVNNQPLVAPFDTISNICPTPLSNLSNSVTITDSLNCTVLQSVVIINPDLLDANVTGNGILCNNECNGATKINPIGGTGTYTVVWSPYPSPADSVEITGLCPGNYLATVSDINGCVDTMTYTVNDLQVLSVSLDSTNITCNGSSNGNATANITGGTTPYTISWVGPCTPAITDTSFVDNLCPGVYSITVSDFNGCSVQGSIIIEEPELLTDSSFVSPANCGISNGIICMFPRGGTQPYSHSWSNGESSNCITNLPAGFYTDTVTDFNGCEIILSIGVSNPDGPSGITATVNDATCFESCNGSINVLVIGGTPEYDYAWTGPNAFTGTDSTETGLCAGTYNLTVTDSALCLLATNIVVGEADSITANPFFTNTSCNASCDGTASVTPTGGTAPHTYLWSHDGSTGASVSGLCLGSVNVTISDFYGCQEIVTFNIGSPNALTVSSNINNPTCTNLFDGSAEANPIGGTSPFNYQWNDLSSQTGRIASGLNDGTYIVTVTDFNSCSITDTITIVEPTPITVTPITTLSTCGNSDGTADVCGSIGGTGSHTYLWTDVAGNPTTCIVNGLASGTYTVEISDNNLCTETFLISISDVDGPDVIVTTIDATCDGICNGQVSASATGVATLTYEWQTGGEITPNVTGLCAGNYTVEVKDGNGCMTTKPATIIDNTAITATTAKVSPTCNTDCDGSILVTPNGGTPPYTYSWIGGNAAGQTINAVGGLCAGNYIVTITDFLGCSFPQNITLTEPNLLTVAIVGTAANCNGSCDGQAIANPTGGTAPYTYLWSNSLTTSTINALCAGDYTVIVTDFNGCSSQRTITIGDGINITANITQSNATCGQCDGAITVLGAGGAGAPYTYSWLVSGSTSPTKTNLCPGAYTLTIADNLFCTQQFNILIDNVNGPSLGTLADSVSCFGVCDGLSYTSVTGGTPTYTYLWDDPLLQTNDSASGLCSGLYSIVVKDGLGCISIDTITVPEPLEIISTITFTDPSCPSLCDGTATVTITGGVGNLLIDWGANAANQTTATATGLCEGTYIVSLEDENGCTKFDSIIINDPSAITITASTTTPTCFGDCDGTAIANASGGKPGYQYSWDTTPEQNNSLIGGLCATAPNFIRVTVTDNNGCIAVDSVQITNPPILAITSDSINPTCNGTCDGSVTANPTGGVQPYTYTWSNGLTTPTISNLCAGTYSVIIIDRNNCTVNDTIVLTETTLDVGIVPSDPDCGVDNGAITSTPIGVGLYDFVWTNTVDPATILLTVLNAANSNISGLSDGTYNLQITDQSTTCITNHIVILNNTDAPVLSITKSDETCLNRCDGSATVTATGGTLPYSYSWSPAVVPNDTLATTTSLCADFYTVTVTDSNNCISSDTITINTLSLDLTISNVSPESCHNACDGTATVTATGGTPNYNYLWSPTAQGTPQATGLCEGVYVAIVTDGANCSDSISTIITGPEILEVVALENSAITCNGLSDGNAIANVRGGSPFYLYSWNTTPEQTSQIATNLNAGSYIVTVTDLNGCTAIDTIILTEPDSILDNSILTAPACGVCDGNIVVAPSGVSSNYDVTWVTPLSPPQTPILNTTTIIDLCAGAYTITITDNSTGCSADFDYALSNTNGPDPNTSVTNPSCNAMCDGKIISNPIGTAPPYAFSWNPSGSLDSITNLCVGTYDLTVTDSNGCTGVAFEVLTEPAVMFANLTATDLTCNAICDGTVLANTTGGTMPYSYSWSPVVSTDSNLTGLCAGTYIVTILDSNSNCQVIDSISIIEPPAITSTSTQIDASCISSCNGEATFIPIGGSNTFTYQWNGNVAIGQTNTLTGLCVGLNQIEIFDQNGCNIINSVTIGATDTVLSYAGVDTSYCLGDPVTLIGIPGGTFTNVEWFELPSMTSIGTTDTVTITSPFSGTISYAFEVQGACNISDTVDITIVNLPNIDAGDDISIFEDESIQLNASGGDLYSWSPSTGLSDTTIANPEATPLVTTTYLLTAYSSYGCIATDSLTVNVFPLIDYSDGITPNGDGVNDLWTIAFIELYPENVVEIYNRWGELLFQVQGYQQDWDGTYNGKELPIGTYYYIIDLKDESIKPFTGPITILR